MAAGKNTQTAAPVLTLHRTAWVSRSSVEDRRRQLHDAPAVDVDEMRRLYADVCQALEDLAHPHCRRWTT